MGLSRYKNDSVTKGGKLLASAKAVMRIRTAIKSGQITLRIAVLKQNQRLDIIAGEVYGDGRLWWVIAAASNIGWSLQVPAGTRLAIPTNLGEIEGVI
jgi:hypothetical protein